MITPGKQIKAPEAATLAFHEPETLSRLKTMLAPIEFKVAVTGTNPGIGVSTFTMHLALALSHMDSDFKWQPTIGILDLGGSAFPQRLGSEARPMEKKGSLFFPARGLEDIRVVTWNMLADNRFTPDGDWRSVQASLGKIEWGRLDILLIEFPTGMETAGDLSEVLPPIDASLIVTRPGNGERDRIRELWKFFDSSSIPAVGLVSNMAGRYKGEDVEELGQTFGIPMRATIPYEPMLASVQAGPSPYILSRKESALSKTFVDFSDDLVDYLVWLHDEHEQEEDF